MIFKNISLILSILLILYDMIEANNDYIKSLNIMNYNDAMIYCEKEHKSKLVLIKNNIENNEILQLCGNNTTCWIGNNNISSIKQNKVGLRDCIGMIEGTNGKWNNIDCNDKYIAICEGKSLPSLIKRIKNRQLLWYNLSPTIPLLECNETLNGYFDGYGIPQEFAFIYYDNYYGISINITNYGNPFIVQDIIILDPTNYFEIINIAYNTDNIYIDGFNLINETEYLVQIFYNIPGYNIQITSQCFIEPINDPTKSPSISPIPSTDSPTKGPTTMDPTYWPTSGPTMEPTVSTPSPTVPTPSPTVSTPLPTVSTPSPTVPTPSPTVSTPSPTVPTPSPTISTPSPTVPTPSPTVSTPSPTVPTPSPTVSTPSPTVPTPSPTVSTPSPTIDCLSCCLLNCYANNYGCECVDNSCVCS